MYRRGSSTYSCRERLIDAVRYGRDSESTRKYNVFIDVERKDLYNQEFLDYVSRLCNVRIVNHKIRKGRWNNDMCTTSIDVINSTFEEISLATWLFGHLGGIYDKTGKELITELLKKNLITEFERYSGWGNFRKKIGTVRQINTITLMTIFGLYLKENNVEIIPYEWASGIVSSIYKNYTNYLSLFIKFVDEFNLRKDLKECYSPPYSNTFKYFINQIVQGE
jgi:hypothetical protein